MVPKLKSHQIYLHTSQFKGTEYKFDIDILRYCIYRWREYKMPRYDKI